MSPHTHYELARTRQLEIAASVRLPHRAARFHEPSGRTPSCGHARIRRAIATVAAAFAAAAVAVSVAPASQTPAREVGHLSPAQYTREIRALEARGYVQSSCTVNGTQLRNPRTGRSVTVRL
jgi:hypothetical protein